MAWRSTKKRPKRSKMIDSSLVVDRTPRYKKSNDHSAKATGRYSFNRTRFMWKCAQRWHFAFTIWPLCRNIRYKSELFVHHCWSVCTTAFVLLLCPLLHDSHADRWYCEAAPFIWSDNNKILNRQYWRLCKSNCNFFCYNYATCLSME